MAQRKSGPRKRKGFNYSTLPAQLTSFIGRKHEIERVKQMLGHTRLLTLTGTGGCGKTRLALRVLEDFTKDPVFKYKIIWVDLASLIDTSLVPQTIATSIGLHEKTGEPIIQTITLGVKKKYLLLALDNCEHLVAACASVVDSLLRACPNLKVLTTSRELLNVPGEVSWLIPSLAFLEAGSTQPSLDDIAQYDAVELFMDRAVAISPDFKLTEHNAGAILQICRRLEGIPLAIELAAAHIRMLSVAQIADRLDNVFYLLTSGNRTATIPRHQTLHTAISWSYDLLADFEKVIFRRLAVFIGGFTLEAVGAVINEPDIYVNTANLAIPEITLSQLSSLINKSLVIAHVPEQGVARYHMLETIRQFAQEKLIDAGEKMDIHNRHSSWYLMFSEEAETQWRGPNQIEWLERTEIEHENLRAAMRWYDETAKFEDELRIASALLRFWIVRGYLREGSEVLGKVLSRGAQISDSILSKAYHAAGTLAVRQSNYPDAQKYLELALDIRRKLADKHGISISLNNLASVAINRGEYPRARKYLAESVNIKRTLNDKVGLAYSLGNLGEVARQEGDFATASRLYEETLSLLNELDDKDTIAIVLVSLGNLHISEGNLKRATERFYESLSLARKIGNKWAIAMCTAGLALISRQNGELQLAARLLGAAQSLFDQIGMPLEPIDRNEFDRNLSDTKSKMDDALYNTSWADGRRMDLEQLMDVLGRISVSTLAHERSDRLDINAFGTARVLLGKHVITPFEWKGLKTKELFFLILSVPSLKKEQIGLALWPDSSSSQLRNNLGVTMHNLRHALGKSEWILYEDDTYKFNRTMNYAYDVEDFETSLRLAKNEKTETSVLLHLQKAISLYRGEYLDDFLDGEWFIPRREELRQKYIDTLLTLGNIFYGRAQYKEAIEVYRLATTHDPYLEIGYRELMRCYVQLGERAQAIRQYHTLSDILSNELNALPAPETTALYEQLRKDQKC